MFFLEITSGFQTPISRILDKIRKIWVRQNHSNILIFQFLKLSSVPISHLNEYKTSGQKISKIEIFKQNNLKTPRKFEPL
jgi:hypothetical protein